MTRKKYKDFNRVEKSIVWVLIAIIIIGIFRVQINGYYYNQKLEKCNFITTDCRISHTKYIYIKNIGLHVWYYYVVNGRKYKKEENLGLYYQDTMKDILLNKTLPIVYCEDNPKYCILLLDANDLKKFGLELPDSLNWTENYKSGFAN